MSSGSGLWDVLAHIIIVAIPATLNKVVDSLAEVSMGRISECTSFSVMVVEGKYVLSDSAIYTAVLCLRCLI